jgi:hypothetical protein
MGNALAIRAYTASEIVQLLGVPLRSEPMQTSFLPQSAPACVAMQNFLKLREEQRQYAYGAAPRRDLAARLAARS